MPNDLTQAKSTPSTELEGKDALQMLGAVAALLCGLLYLIQYLAVEDFYRQFGRFSPEFAGMDQTVLLTRIGVVAFVLSWMVVVGAGVVAAVARAVRWGVSGSVTGNERLWVQARRLLPAGIAGVWLGLCTIDLDRGISTEVSLWAVMLVGAVSAAGALSGASLAPARYRRWARVLVMTLLIAMPAGAWADQAMAERGHRLAQTGQFGYVERVLGVRIQYVHADFTHADGQPDYKNGPYIHLGEAGGMVALYDCAHRQVHRVAVPQVRLTTDLDGRIRQAVVDACQRAS
ncbi:hypothetical protein [Streptomyces sp. NPDC048111]|uniref:hypothetical protein n=1 Tax=Streptomyces sp. NPDC048111 TaxID=3365500 RepID=UPI003715E262